MTTTTEQPLDLIVSRIAKLWRKANDSGATPEEREAFEAKALSLMEEHRITEAMLDLGYEDVLGDHFAVKLSGRDARMTIDLLDTIARAFDSRVYWSGYGLTYNVYVFGFKSDFNRIMPLFTMLLSDCAAGAAALKGYDASHTSDLRRGFRQGYRSAISRRLTEAKRHAEEAARRRAALETLFGPEALDEDLDWSDYEDEIAEAAAADTTVAGASLVLVEKAKRVENEYLKKTMRHAAGTRTGSYTARQQGMAAGQRANLNPGRGGVAGARKALAS
jgi:hypothetical protein